MRFGRMQVVNADVRIYVQEVRAVHTVASDGGMRAAVRLPGMRRAFSPCPPDRTRLPHHVGRSASGRCKVRAHHRRIARPAAILARSWIVQEGETCQGESVSASLTESRVASSLKHRRAASGCRRRAGSLLRPRSVSPGNCASAMLGGPNRVAALVFHPDSGLPRPAVCMIAHEDSNESHPHPCPSRVIFAGLAPMLLHPVSRR